MKFYAAAHSRPANFIGCKPEYSESIQATYGNSVNQTP